MPKRGFKRESQKERKKKISILTDPSPEDTLTHGADKPSVEEPCENLNKVVEQCKNQQEVEATYERVHKAEEQSKILHKVEEPHENLHQIEEPCESLHQVEKPHENLHQGDELIETLHKTKELHESLHKIEEPCGNQHEVEEPPDNLHRVDEPCENQQNKQDPYEDKHLVRHDEYLENKKITEEYGLGVKKEGIGIQNGQIDEDNDNDSSSDEATKEMKSDSQQKGINDSKKSEEYDSEQDITNHSPKKVNYFVENGTGCDVNGDFTGEELQSVKTPKEEKMEDKNLDTIINHDNVDTQSGIFTDAHNLSPPNDNRNRRVSLKGIKRETQKERKKRLLQMTHHGSFDVYPNHGVIGIEQIVTKDKERQKEMDMERLRLEEQMEKLNVESTQEKQNADIKSSQKTNKAQNKEINMETKPQLDDLNNNALNKIDIKMEVIDVDKEDSTDEEISGVKSELNYLENCKPHSDEELRKHVESEEESSNVVKTLMSEDSVDIYRIVQLDSLEIEANMDEDSLMEKENMDEDSLEGKEKEMMSLDSLDSEGNVDDDTLMGKKNEVNEKFSQHDNIIDTKDKLEEISEVSAETIPYNNCELTKNISIKEESLSQFNSKVMVEEVLEFVQREGNNNLETKTLVEAENSFDKLDEEEIISEKMMENMVDTSIREYTYECSSSEENTDNEMLGLKTADKNVQDKLVEAIEDNSALEYIQDITPIEKSGDNGILEDAVENANTEQQVHNITSKETMDGTKNEHFVDNAIIAQTAENIPDEDVVNSVFSDTFTNTETILQNIEQSEDKSSIKENFKNVGNEEVIDTVSSFMLANGDAIKQTIIDENDKVDTTDIFRNENMLDSVAIDTITNGDTVINDNIEQFGNNSIIEETVETITKEQFVSAIHMEEIIEKDKIEQAAENDTTEDISKSIISELTVDNTSIKETVGNIDTERTIINNPDTSETIDVAIIEDTVDILTKSTDQVDNSNSSIIDPVNQLRIVSLDETFFETEGKFHHIDDDLGFGYVTDTDDKPRAKVILKKTSPFFDNDTKMSHHRLANFHFYSLAFNVWSNAMEGGMGRTVYMFRHFLDLSSLSSHQIQSIRVAACEQDAPQQFHFLKPLWVDNKYICVQQNNYHWFQVVSEFNHLPIQMNLVPFCQKKSLHPTIFICPLPRGRHHIQKMLQENPGWKKCGYEEPCVLSKGVNYTFFDQDRMDVPSYGEIKTETRSEDTLWVKYSLERGTHQTFIRTLLKDQWNQNQIVYNGHISLYEYMRLDSDLSQFQKSAVNLDLTSVDDSLLADASLPGIMSNMEPFYEFVRSGRLTTSQLLSISHQMGVTKNVETSHQKDIHKQIKEIIHDWKDQEGPAATLSRFISILRMTDVALTSIAMEIYQNVTNKHWI